MPTKETLLKKKQLLERKKELLLQKEKIGSTSREEPSTSVTTNFLRQLNPFSKGASPDIPFSEPKPRERGERSFLGNIFERPAASNREALRANPFLAIASPTSAGALASTGIAGKNAKEAAIRGSNFPEESETFQQEFIEKAQNVGGPSKNIAVNFMKGQLPSTVGLATDLITNPADVATEITSVGLSRGFKNIGKLVKESDKLSKVVDKNIIKAIRPSVANQRTAKQVSKFKGNSRLAVDTIIDNKKNLKLIREGGVIEGELPKNLADFSQAIDQTKTSVFNQYDNLLKKSGKNGAFVDLKPVASELDNVINSKTLAIKDPSIIQYAENLKSRISQADKLTVSEADQLIKQFNESLEVFYRNPTFETVSRATVDAAVVNNLRKTLDKVVNATANAGGGFQSLKNKYGSLRAIERDVNRRALVNARRNVRGLIDFTDVFSGGDIVRGIISLNPGQIAKGGTQFGIKQFFKILNNPDRIIERMFRDGEKVKRSTDLIKKMFPVTGTAPTSSRALSQ